MKMLISRSANRDEFIKRLKEAAGYQRQAVKCLLPESMGKHLDVIGNELKMMIIEAAVDLVKNEEVSEKKSGSKKVEIL